MKETKLHDYLKRCRRGISQIQHLSMIKTLRKVGIKGIFLTMIKAIYEKPTANMILKD